MAVNWSDDFTEREKAVWQLYNDLLGRLPDEGGFQHYVYDSNIPINIVRHHIEDSDEYWKKNAGVPTYGVGLGTDKDASSQQHQYFGGADYIEALKVGGKHNLKRTRNEVLDWLKSGENFRWLHPNARKGQSPEGGPPSSINFFDRLEGAGAPNRDINPYWGDASQSNKNFFTHDDLMATRAINFKEHQIKSVLDQNPDWLLDADKPGVAGGVYESLNLGWEDSYVHDPTSPDSPTVTRTSSEYDISIGRETISQPDRESLKMTPGQAFVGKTARGVNKAKRTRRRVRQTTDLQRSLNIS